MNFHDHIGGFQVVIYAHLSTIVIAPGIDLSFICERQRMRVSADHLNLKTSISHEDDRYCNILRYEISDINL